VSYRDLRIRVLGEFSNRQYARLAYEIGVRLRAAGLANQAILMPDDKITSRELATAWASPGVGGADGEHVGKPVVSGQGAANPDY
jgi:hypothetical protein